MDGIIEAIGADIHQLRLAAKALLAGETNARKVGKPGKRKKSAAKAKMAEAQQARRAKAKRGK